MNGPTALLPAATVEAPETITVPAGDATDIDVTIAASESGWPNHQYGGYVELTPADGDASTLRVPYAGYDGDYGDLPLFGYYADVDEVVERPPRLSKLVFEDDEVVDVEPVDPGHAFSVRDGDFPVLEAFFGHFPRAMEVYAVHRSSGRRWPVMDQQYLPRSPLPDYFYPFVWDGQTRAGGSDAVRPVPSGSYTLEVRVLHTVGDSETPEHWETWESPPFELDTHRADGEPTTSQVPEPAEQP